MSNKVLTVSDGTFILSETEVKNQFYFYRKDKKPLGDVENIPLVLFSQYLVLKVEGKEIPEPYQAELLWEVSEDEKVIRLTATEKTSLSDTEELQPQPQQRQEPTFFERVQSILHMFRKWFGE